MTQQVYQLQVLLLTTQDQLTKRLNVFSLTTDSYKQLNALMPVGYIIIPKQKNQLPLLNKKDSYQSMYLQRNTNKSNYSQPKLDSTCSSSQPLTQLKKLSPQMQKCMKIMTRLKNHPQGYVFLDPVDTTIITDYLDYVNCTKLGTIEYNILNGIYQTFTQFMIDVKKVWYNAYKYNPPGTPIYLMTVEIDKFFDSLLRNENIPIQNYGVQSSVREPLLSLPRPQPIKKKVQSSILFSDVPLTIQQKRNLGSMIKRMPHEYLTGVWQIVSTVANKAHQQLQFDIETLPPRKARQLQQYVKKTFADIDAQNKQVTSFNVSALDNQQQNQSSFMIDEDSD